MNNAHAVCIGLLILLLHQTACSKGDGLELAEEREVTRGGLVIQNRGYMKDGQKHGVWYEYRGGRLYYLRTWKDGVQHGVEQSFYIDGILLADRYYVNGQLHGRSRLFSDVPNRLVGLFWWSRGLQDGFWCDWSDDGRLIKLQEYSQGDHIRTESPPRGACPYTSSDLGAHHFDPDDRTYKRPYKQSTHRTRPIPLHR